MQSSGADAPQKNPFRPELGREVITADLPVIMGYVPLGLACGVLAASAGLTLFEMFLMSLLVFAGSGQFIGIAMIGSGTSSIISIVLTTFIVNLRHLLYSSTLMPFLRGGSLPFLLAYAQEIVDESFAVNENRFSRNAELAETDDAYWTPGRAMGVNFTGHITWICATATGCALGSMINIDTTLVGYTLTAMFIGLWSFHFKNCPLIAIGLLSGALSLLLSLWLDFKLHIVISTVLAATAGLIYEKMTGRLETEAANGENSAGADKGEEK